ncbi:MAG: GNAT family N-acetyltransferase [Chloroflexota bacterium]
MERTFHIRPFRATDKEYARVVAINNALWPDELNTIENLKYDDKTLPAERFFQRSVVELESVTTDATATEKMIGEVWCGLERYEADPSRYSFGINVDPRFKHLEYGENGIFTLAMTHVQGIFQARDPKPTRLITFWREDQATRLAYLKAEGFTVEMRYPESELDVTTFDPTPFLPRAQQVADMGIEILSLPQLQTRFDDWLERCYEMDMEILPDDPSTGEFRVEPIQEYATLFEHPSFLAEGWFVAVLGDTLVGSSSVWANKADPQRLYTNFTGVRRSYRRKGITTALKLAIVDYAQQQGVTSIRTDNEENNPMYQINLKLGFQPRPAWLELHKRL